LPADSRARWGGSVHHHGPNRKAKGWTRERQRVQHEILRSLGHEEPRRAVAPRENDPVDDLRPRRRRKRRERRELVDSLELSRVHAAHRPPLCHATCCGYVCTRSARHPGLHVAHGDRDRPVAAWRPRNRTLSFEA
jgi:hypothetical protein